MTSPLVLNTPLSLQFGKKRADDELSRTLSLVLVRQALGSPSVAELDFDHPSRDASSPLRIGVELRLESSERELVFEGQIVRVEHSYDGANGHVVRIRAYDRLQRLRERRRVGSFPKVSAASLAAKFAADIDCDSAVARAAPERELLVQHGQSDLDLLVDLAGDAGLYPFLVDRTIRLIALDGEDDALPLSLGRTLHTLQARLSNERALSRCEAHGWNLATSHCVQAATETASQDAMR